MPKKADRCSAVLQYSACCAFFYMLEIQEYFFINIYMALHITQMDMSDMLMSMFCKSLNLTSAS